MGVKQLKNKFLSLLSVILVLVGLILMFLPKLNTYVVEKRTAKNVTAVEMISPETLQANLESEAEFDFDSILEISPSQTFLSSSAIDKSLILGRLTIPSIDLNLVVYNGVTNSILLQGAGTMRPNLKMGEGNFPIAGHYTRNKKTLFGDLISVNIGDLIYLTDNEKMYEYKVYDTTIVDPSETELIEDEIAEERGKPIISLMNCYYVDGKNTDKRYFVFAELIDFYDLD